MTEEQLEGPAADFMGAKKDILLSSVCNRYETRTKSQQMKELESEYMRTEIASRLAEESVKAVKCEDGSMYVCVLNPDEPLSKEEHFELDYKLLGYWSFSEVKKVNGDGSVRFMMAVNDPDTVSAELRKLLQRVAEKAIEQYREGV